MKMPFPGMDPYLEHLILWESVHARLMTAIADQLQPLLDPRYVATVEERVFVEGPQRRIPDVWVQKTKGKGKASAVLSPQADSAVILEVEELEIHQRRVEILDAYNELRLVALIELLSPTNKLPGPARRSYREKQRETLERECHLIEIDLLRRGRHVLSVPRWRLEELRPYEYLVCVNRWPRRNRFELYARRLRERLPHVSVPLAEPDPDVTLDLQSALETIYWNGRYVKRVRYEEPCMPPLAAKEQKWANKRWSAYKAAQPDLFPNSKG